MRNGRQIAMHIPNDVYHRLRDSARRNRRTMTCQVVLALNLFLDVDESARSNPPGWIPAILEEVENGSPA
jgi:hypothetical protein